MDGVVRTPAAPGDRMAAALRTEPQAAPEAGGAGRGTVAWRRVPADATDLTPIGRLLFPGGRMRMVWWRRAAARCVFVLHAAVAAFLLLVTLLTLYGVATAAPGRLAGAALAAALFAGILAWYIGAAIVPDLAATRRRTWPAGMLVARRSRNVWIDRARSGPTASGRGPAIREAVTWQAECALCGAPLMLLDRDGTGGSAPVGVCEAAPRGHCFSFDRETLSGASVEPARRGPAGAHQP